MNAKRAFIARTGDHAQFGRIATALVALAVGVLIYAAVRPQPAVFLPVGWHHPVLVSKASPLTNALIGAAPTFLHAFAMSVLIVVATQTATPRGRGWCCAAVCAVEFAFEIAQYTVVAVVLLGSVTASSTAGGIAGALRSYIRHGTFDPLDLVAACAGCFATYAVLAHATHDRQTSLGASHATA